MINPSENHVSKFRELSVHDRILVSLMDGDLHFSKLMEKVGCSQGVLGTQLIKLRTKGLVVRGEHDEKHRNGCSPHHLTVEGRKEARSINFRSVFNRFTEQDKENFYLTLRINSASFWIPNILALSEEIDWDNEKKIPFIRKFAYQENREKAKAVIEAIDTELSRQGYSDEETITLWLIDGGKYVLQTLLNFAGEDFKRSVPFEVTAWNSTEEEKKKKRLEIKLALKKRMSNIS